MFWAWECYGPGYRSTMLGFETPLGEAGERFFWRSPYLSSCMPFCLMQLQMGSVCVMQLH